jgi:hypothetical protein
MVSTREEQLAVLFQSDDVHDGYLVDGQRRVDAVAGALRLGWARSSSVLG